MPVVTSVTDRHGNYVRGLDRSDFLVFDNGQLQEASLDTCDASGFAPISLVIAVQSSGAASAVLAKLPKVASMIGPMITGERGEVAVLMFDQKIALVQDFTSDPGAITQALRNVQPGEYLAGRMLDAVAESSRLLAKRPPGRRRVLLLIAESRDRGSETKLPAALTMAQKADLIVYPATFSVYATPFTAKQSEAPPAPGGANLLGIFTELGRKGKVNTAQALARATGGHMAGFLTVKSLERVVTNLGEELHSQYLLSFSPAVDAPPGLHRIEVKVRNREDLVVRSRPGYLVE